MSITLGNTAAANHEAKKERWINAMLRESGHNPESFEPATTEARYRLGNAYEEQFTHDSQYFGMSEGWAMWFAEQCSAFRFDRNNKIAQPNKLLSELRDLYRAVRDGQVEFKDPFADMAATVGAAMQTVPAVGYTDTLVRIEKLGKFVKNNIDGIYSV